MTSLAVSGAVLIFWILPLITTQPTQQCLDCICQASSGCDLSKKCQNAAGGAYFCGPYQISWSYWSDGNKPGFNGGPHDFENCLNNKQCAEQAVTGYMSKWARDCNGDGIVDCADYAAIHKTGPHSCNAQWLYETDYWKTFQSTQCGKGVRSNASFPSIPGKNNITVDISCLQCLCQASTGCNLDKQCEGGVCGPYLISSPYWIDSGKPGLDFVRCVLNASCAESTVRNYMRRFGKDCNKDGKIDCDDFALIHKYGPNCGPGVAGNDKFWTEFGSCVEPSIDERRLESPRSAFPVNDSVHYNDARSLSSTQLPFVSSPSSQSTFSENPGTNESKFSNLPSSSTAATSPPSTFSTSLS